MCKGSTRGSTKATLVKRTELSFSLYLLTRGEPDSRCLFSSLISVLALHKIAYAK